MATLTLVVFDVDGTLVDSEGDIVLAMNRAYESVGMIPPQREEIHAVIGLSLPVAFARLSDGDYDQHGQVLEAAYRRAYADLRLKKGSAASSPLIPGVAEVLAQLGRNPWTLLGVATGKSRRGLDALIEAHGLRGVFATTQVANQHPSKPDPSMLGAALAETGVEAANAVMIGDTTYDIQMGRAAGFATLGVGWGYHPVKALISAGADLVVDEVSQLTGAVEKMLGSRV